MHRNALPAQIGALMKRGLGAALFAVVLAAPAMAEAQDIADHVGDESCYGCQAGAEAAGQIEDDSCYTCYTADGDGDGIPDRDESDLYDTNPMTPDSDNDSLRDGDELFHYGTNPNDGDSDHDGLPDATEVYLCNETCTDPWNPDSDGDGILDGDDWGNP